MFRIDHPTAGASLPTPAAAGTPGYFRPGNPSLGLSGTVITTDWANTIQEEMANVVTAGGLVLSKTSNTQMRDALDARYAGVAAGIGGFRNAIINGGFDIWQRGTSFSNPGNTEHVADRWRVIWNGSGATRTISRVVPTGSLALTGRTAWLRWAQTVAGTTATTNSLTERVEGAATLSGRQVTVSFCAYSTVGAFTMPSIQLQQVFGTGGSPSSTTTTGVATNVAITTTPTRFSYTVTLPATTASVFGSNGDDYLMLRINLPLNAVFSVDITNVQIEAGPVATAFERRDPATELMLCMRHFETSNPGGSAKSFALNGGTAVAAGHASGQFRLRVPFLVPKRAVPTVTIYDSPGTANRVSCFYEGSTWGPDVVLTVGPTSTASGFYVGHNQATTIETQFSFEASSEL